MDNRRMEFMEKVKFALDKSEARRDAEEFAKEIQGMFSDTKIGFDANSLKQLGELFNEKLKEIGKKPIVFSDITIDNNALKEITTRFMRAIGDGISAGVQNSVKDAMAEIAKLEKLKTPKIDRKKELEKKKTGFTALQNVRGDENSIHPHPLAKEKDITAQAKQIYNAYKEAKELLIEADGGYSDEAFEKALDNYYDAVDKMYRMRQTIKNHEDEFADDELVLFKKFDFKRLNKEVDGTFKEVGMTLNSYISSRTNDYQDEAKKINIELENINNRITEIKNNNPEIISQEAANKSLKSLEEVEKAYDRIAKKSNKKEVNSYKLNDINSAIDYDAEASNKQGILKELSKKLDAAGGEYSDNWEEAYQWVVKFVKQYKYLEDNGKLSNHLKANYESRYKELVGIAENAEKSLISLRDRAMGITQSPQIVDNKENLIVEKESTNVQNDAADAAEREKRATEETLKIEEKRQKLLLYRIGKTKFSPRNTDMMGNSVGTRLDGFGGYGDGLFAVTKDAVLDIAKSDIKPNDPESYFEFDASKYNLYINKTVEQAQAMKKFSDKLQKFILAAGDFRGFDDEIQGIDEKSLFSEATQVFGQINMSQEEFATWITSMKQLVVDNGLDSNGVFSKADESFLNSRNFFTRFMQTQGYQGVLNDTGDNEIDGMTDGSVIYEPDFTEITEYIKSNEAAFKKVKDFLFYITKSKELTNAIIEDINSNQPKSLTPLELFDEDETPLRDVERVDNTRNEVVVHEENAKAIQQETVAQEILNTTKQEEQQIEQTDTSSTQVTEENTETDAIQKQNEALKENINLRQMVEKADGAAHGQTLSEVSGTSTSGATGVGINTQELQNILSNITYKVQVVQKHDAPDADKKAALIDIEALKQALGQVTYNTKLVKDDADKTANKIALDDSVLEATLNRVFANILNPSTQQNDGNTQESWALESTLQTVKSVLDNIYNNIAKIGTVETSTTVDNKVLSAIKTAVESINKKIVQGTKVIKTGDKKKEKKTDKPEIKNSEKEGYTNPKKVDKRLKALQTLYEDRGVLEARLEQDANDSKVQVALKQNEEDILNLKKEGIEFDEQELTILKEKAKQRETELLLAQKANEARKKATQDEKADLRARIKQNKEENRVNASTSTWNAGNKALESLWKIDDKENPLELQSVKDLSTALKELNTVRQRVNENLRKGIEISEADSKELRDKTEQVAMHTEAVNQLISNYTALNGANVTETGRVIDPNADIETQLINATRELTSGQAKIGTFDAATNRLTYTVKTGAYEFKEYEMAVREAGGAIVSVQGDTKRTETFFEGFKKKLSELFRYFSASSLIYKAFNEIKKGIQYIRDIDSALTELKKVTDETEETYDKFLDTASKTAAKVGSTIKDVISSTADWARLNI